MSKKYIEIVLDFLIEKAKSDKFFMCDEMQTWVLNIDNKITKLQIKSALNNFVKLLIIEAKGGEVYHINRKALDTFVEQYKKGIVPIWKRKKDSIDDKKTIGVEGIPELYRNNQTFYLRAIFAAFPGPFSSPKLMELSKKTGFNYITSKTIQNVRRRIVDCFDVQGKDGPAILFSMNRNFYKRYKNEKALYQIVFPDREDFINKAFSKALDEQKPIESTADQDISEEEKTVETCDDQDEQKKQLVETENPFRTTIKRPPRYIVAAIFAAYDKPLSINDIMNIASNFGYRLVYGSIHSYCHRILGSVLLINGKRTNQLLYSPGAIFFENYSGKIDLLIKILPEKADKIKARFNMFYQRESADDDKEEVNAAMDQGAADNIQEDINSNENQSDYVEAAKVGASIIKYIRTLQNRLKKQEEDPTVLNELRDKLEQSQLFNINLKNENQNLEYQVNKLKTMLETSNEKIISLTHQLSVLKNRRQNEKEPLPTKFSLSELARVTRFVKDSKSNGKNKDRIEENVE